MTATVNPFPRVQRNLKGFIRVLKFAACEWMLIFLLFIDAAFSYMVTSFAQYCELQIPCILCSRLDHVFGNAKDGFYRTLFCRSHRSEISFLLSCNIHDKLVDSSGMCDECLASHVEGNESNSDMKRLVSGKLGYDGNCCSQVDEDPTSAYKFTRLCLCCNKPWIPRPSSNRSLLLKSSTSVSKPSIPLPRSLSPINDLKKMNDTVPGKTGFEHLSHVGEPEVKISSESESAFPATDNDTGGSIIRNINENKKEQADDPNESHDLRCLAPENENVVSEHKVKANFNELPELISLDNYPPTSCLMEVPSFSASLLAADLIPLVDTSNSVNAKDVPLEPENENVSVNKNDEILKLISTTTGARFEADQVADDTAMLNSTDGDPSEPEFVTKHMLTNNNEVHEDHKSLPVETIFEPSKTESDEISKLISSSTQTVFGTDRLGDDTAIVNSTDGDRIAVQELPVCGEEKSASEFVTEPTNGVNGEVQSLSGQSTSREGIHLSLNNLSPELQDRAVELLRSESNSEEVRNLQNLFFEAINDSPGLKYFEESSVIEGENPLDTLKQEVDNYRNYINALSKELDEERNASAIAANQAMAMITRLQEEKAALRMEALQYLRMMEEQAEYDVDALEKANDLLTEKEKEVQDLEAELEYYKYNFPDETSEETKPEANINLDKEYVSMENNTSTCSKQDDMKYPLETMLPEASTVVDDHPVVITAWSEIEDEKSYISQWLQKLEKKLNMLAQYGTSSPQNSDGGREEKDHTPVQEASSMANGTGVSQETSISKDEEENCDTVSNGQEGSEDWGEISLDALENEIAELNERLEALETDCSFLHRSLNALKNGKKGLLLIQEILHLLREVKKFGLKTMNLSVL
ncbi:myosin-binding protein 1 [Gossypium raimondii]|uniref:GTD-binding domain-containing protein n=1 Tax=Gossypium raimondii TaxID=29730 RepID=A0A0D2SBU0_GOSRA|nr:myosin-binding protein 1 [Gossypium raimondii]XP_052489263.1 myosin-binding protein 1 [Gossypium raimondii]KJB80562.1 hypothetical protein B456_013G104100 [Gossypium raimondii]MBA0602550.1 hypothetical protein [Gossypium raimondii]